MKITSLLLAGGQSERMGKDKRLLEYQGKPLIRSAFEATQAISDELWVLIASQEDQRILSPLLDRDTRFLLDEHPNSGPLGALASALPRVQCEYALLLAVDYPLVTGPFLQKMKGVVETQAPPPDAFVPLWQGSPQVACAFYRRSLHMELRATFLAGERSLRRWTLGLPKDRVRWLHEEDWQQWGHPGVSLNVNTPQDYERLLQLARSPLEK